MQTEAIHFPDTNAFSRLIRRAVLCLILLEIFLGGGGRLIDVGALSIRMYIFVFAMCLGALYIFSRPLLKTYVITIVLGGTLVIGLGVLIGVMNQHDSGLIFEDVKPLLFLYSILFMPFLIRDYNDVELVVRLLKISAIILALSYLLILVLIHSKLIPFAPFYNWCYETQEFFFRGEFAFFYKGFFFMCIGVFFYEWRQGFWSQAAILAISSAIVLTFTRGFILTFFIVGAIYLVFIKKRAIYILLFVLFALIALPIIWSFVSNEERINRKESNTNRIVQIIEVANEVTPASAFIGHGFGKNISSRQDLHLEIAYLEIFHKQGIVGLMFWLYFCFAIFTRYRKAVKIEAAKAIPLFLAVLFAFIQSLTNPFVNNPLGITLLVVALVSLDILQSRQNQISS